MRKAKEVASSEQKEKLPTVMYVGPSITGVLKQYVIYKNGIPQRISQLADEIPAVKHLLVPIEHITEAKKQINVAGSALNVMYNKVLVYIKGGK